MGLRFETFCYKTTSLSRQHSRRAASSPVNTSSVWSGVYEPGRVAACSMEQDKICAGCSGEGFPEGEWHHGRCHISFFNGKVNTRVRGWWERMFLSLLKFQPQLSKASVTDSNLHLSPAVGRYRNCRDVCGSSYRTCSTLIHAGRRIDAEWVLVFQCPGEVS